MNTKIISFEGIDFCGKSTQIELLVKKLNKKGYPSVVFRDPGATSISEQIRGILLNNKNQNMSALTELMLYEAARTQMVHELIIPALQEGKIVILDRYFDSTTAYQGFGRGIEKNIIDRLNQIAAQGVIPSKTIFLNISIETFQKRKLKYSKETDRLEEAGLEFFRKVIKGYEQLVSDNPNRVVKIDGENEKEEIHEKIWNELEKIL